MLLETSPDEFDDAALPCAGALIAGTLALMTGFAAPDTDAALRAPMARKIVSNLTFLREHPRVPPGLRAVIGKVHARWSAFVPASLH